MTTHTWPYDLVDPIAEPRLGVIVLSRDESLEYEFRGALLSSPVNLLHARIPAEAEVTPEALATMAAQMTAAAALLPEGLGAIAYACTSGATVIGEREVTRLVQKAHPGIPVTNPLTAIKAALFALNARRIALVSPYLPSVTAPLRAALAAADVEIATELSFAQSHDQTVARISEVSTLGAVIHAGTDKGAEVDAVFVSCTNLRSFGIIAQAERELGVPVISSNSALLWHLLTLAGLSCVGRGPGRLFQGEHNE